MRFTRRYPLSLLLVFIPLSLLLYYNYGTSHVLERSGKFVPPVLEAELPDNTTYSADVLLVSAYFPLGKSKHSLEEYRWWLSQYLGKVKTEIYFFAPTEIESFIREIRGDLPITMDTSFATTYDIPPLAGRQKDYDEMHAKDREHDIHSPELYAVWNAKPFFLAHALRTLAEKEGRTYKYAFWCDAGSFREVHAFEDWPSVSRLDELWAEGRALSGTSSQDLFFVPMWDPPESKFRSWKERDGPADTGLSEGSFYGGRAKSVFWFEKYYYAYHDYYLDQFHMFVGKDQTLINALMLLHPEKFISVWMMDPDAPARVYDPAKAFGGGRDLLLGDCDVWYYYMFFLASKQEQTGMRRIWDAKPNGNQDDLERWTRKRESCRQTRLLAIEPLLHEKFGNSWKAPKATVPF